MTPSRPRRPRPPPPGAAASGAAADPAGAFGTAALLRQLWTAAMPPSGAGAPPAAPGAAAAGGASLFLPPLDLDTLERRLAELQAVEQWLALHAGLLRTTIQQLEVQRSALTALHPAPDGAPDAPAPGRRPRARRETASAPPPLADPAAPALWWQALQAQFAQIAATLVAGATAAPAAPAAAQAAPAAKPAATARRRKPR